MIKRNCQHCAEPFHTIPYKLKHGYGKFCSNECKYAAKTNIKDLTGDRYGQLLVLGPVIKPGMHGVKWKVRCDCGVEKVIVSYSMRGGKTVSCGCHRALGAKARQTTHGGTGTTENIIWAGMIQRCENKKKKEWLHYGGRGIKVCRRWRLSFSNFLKDMGLRPSKDHSIDRVNNNGDYKPSNCRWATRSEQMRNRRKKI